MAKRIYKPCIMQADGKITRDTACGSIFNARSAVAHWLRADAEFKNGTHMNQETFGDRWQPIVKTWVENRETGEIYDEREYTPWK